MDADELAQQFRTGDGLIPPRLVSLMIDHGHVEKVRRQAGEDWNCAKGWARMLIEQGQRDAALQVLAPFVDTGWWIAASTAVDILEGGARPEEAIALIRPYTEAANFFAMFHLARLLARNDRSDEAFELLRPHIERVDVASVLVEVTAGLGRDEEVAALLQARIDAARDRPHCMRYVEPSNAVHLLAVVRERQGRVDDAVALMRTSELTSNYGPDELADLLARHGRQDELRAYAAEKGSLTAAECLAQFLEERGEVEAAIEVLRPLVRSGSPGPAEALANLLARNGRVDEAIEMLRPVPYSITDDYEHRDYFAERLYTWLADQGRVEEALAIIDDFAVQEGGMSLHLLRQRVRLLSDSGRTDQAITELRVHPESGCWDGAELLADLLVRAGRLEDAIEVLQPVSGDGDGSNQNLLEELLIRQGRVEEAVAVLRTRWRQA
ncbi:tetratricopeptide repeat protein [Nonomuraea sp. KM88]|uniref:tetratricopeptide repeat protein n=1 Tax=Nonomuraea sp. KM88 TaxID=3457427 RepID=UPI003FCE421A